MSKAKYTNRLIHEKSPYLLQHAHNPVDWYPWGEEVFALAQKEDRLVFLSIGYASCHWCHVMEQESFEDPHTARILNENFLAVKLDREEAPDIDHIYMRSLQAMGQQGGWPLNLFLTPKKLAITGGTYFPPQALYGRPSFVQVLEAVSNAWKTQRQKLLDSAEVIYDFLKEDPRAKGEQKRSSEHNFSDLLPSLLSTSIANCVADLKKAYDPNHGGFLGNGPNKFPPSLQLLFLKASYDKSKEEELLEIIENTLEQIKKGGIYDQIGGGLSRYSTDHSWLVPHFEKMLYDNALFAWILIEIYRITQKEQYRKWILDLFDYIERDMTSPEGAFYSSEDADSGGKEGSFYIWSFEEFQKILKEKTDLSTEERDELTRFWGLSQEGNFEHCNILHEPLRREEFIRNTKYSEEEWESIIAKAREALLQERKKRLRPPKDDKILTSWNAYMISALAQASRVLDLPELERRAQRAADFLWDKLWIPSPKGELLRRFREGEARFSGGLEDYASLACAFLDLYRANFDPENIERANLLGQKIIEKFSKSEGAFYDSPEEKKDLILRMSDPYDGVEPSGNALAARLFFTLGRYGIRRSENQKQLEKILEHFSESLKENGSIHSFLLYVCCHILEEDPWEISILDDSEKRAYRKEAKEVLDWLKQKLSGESVIALGNKSNLDKAIKSLALLSHKPIEKEKSAIYFCRNLRCQKPVYDLDSLRHIIEEN